LNYITYYLLNYFVACSNAAEKLIKRTEVILDNTFQNTEVFSCSFPLSLFFLFSVCISFKFCVLYSI